MGTSRVLSLALSSFTKEHSSSNGHRRSKQQYCQPILRAVTRPPQARAPPVLTQGTNPFKGLAILTWLSHCI
jgi:hypothetical protein